MPDFESEGSDVTYLSHKSYLYGFLCFKAHITLEPMLSLRNIKKKKFLAALSLFGCVQAFSSCS